MDCIAPPSDGLTPKELLRSIKARLAEDIPYSELVAIVRALVGILEKIL